MRRGIDVGKESRSFGQNQTPESLKMMFGQTSDSIKEQAKKNLKNEDISR